jgi:3-deoxy-7-phosphoheptulonate synthase
LIVEVHNHPEEAVSDGTQSLLPVKFSDMMNELKGIAAAVGRKMHENV